MKSDRQYIAARDWDGVTVSNLGAHASANIMRMNDATARFVSAIAATILDLALINILV